jgi:hypothetical protein
MQNAARYGSGIRYIGLAGERCELAAVIVAPLLPALAPAGNRASS